MGMARGSKGGWVLAAIAVAVIVGLIVGMMWIDSYSGGPGQTAVQPRDAADH